MLLEGGVLSVAWAESSHPAGLRMLRQAEWSEVGSLVKDLVGDRPDITAEVIRLLHERLSDAPALTALKNAIQDHRVTFVQGRQTLPPAAAALVDDGILSGPIAAAALIGETPEGFADDVEVVVVYVDMPLSDPGLYLMLIHELVELEVIERALQAIPLTHDAYHQLISLWYSDLMTWLVMVERKEQYRFNDDEYWRASFQAVMHALPMLMVQINHFRINGILEILGDSELGRQFRAVLRIFRTLALKPDVQSTFFDFLQKLVVTYRGDLSRFSQEDREITLRWIEEFEAQQAEALVMFAMPMQASPAKTLLRSL